MMSSGNFPSSSSSVVAVNGKKQRLAGSQPGSPCSSSPIRDPCPVTHAHMHTGASHWTSPAMEILEQDTVLVIQPPKP